MTEGGSLEVVVVGLVVTTLAVAGNVVYLSVGVVIVVGGRLVM